MATIINKGMRKVETKLIEVYIEVVVVDSSCSLQSWYSIDVFLYSNDVTFVYINGYIPKIVAKIQPKTRTKLPLLFRPRFRAENGYKVAANLYNARKQYV